jgi:hypothetical protein
MKSHKVVNITSLESGVRATIRRGRKLSIHRCATIDQTSAFVLPNGDRNALSYLIGYEFTLNGWLDKR